MRFQLAKMRLTTQQSAWFLRRPAVRRKLGDHRNNSSDSRHWGFVPKQYIIGKVQLRWWPLGRTRLF
jgi:hypothetical protein